MKPETRLGSPRRRRLPRRASVAGLLLGSLSASIAAGPASGASSHRASSVVISTTDDPSLGTILVSGTPIYTLRASKVPCSSRCSKIWNTVLLPKHTKHADAGTGVDAAKLGTVRRRGGASR